MRHYTSFLTRRFDFALQFAAALHHHQARKGTSVPYMAHLLGVCSLVLEAGGDEEQAIAALLHDTVEDQGGLATLDTIRRLFGNRVADTVLACSDSTETDAARKPSWRKRKEKYLAHLRTAEPDALLISAADKLHNARTILADYRESGDKVFDRFSAPKADQLWYYTSLVLVLQSRPAPKRIIDELDSVVYELKRLAGANTNTALSKTKAGAP